jgi:organic radical activating enzyme
MKSGFPYLVDIKLTEYCPFGCSFCYQSSTKQGKHAKYFDLYSISSTLKKANVLEVNFGGGEPTLYSPYEYQRFSSVAQIFKENRFRVGVTTKNYGWHKSPDFEQSMKYVDSVAISINSLDEYEKAKDLANMIDWDAAYAQLIFGLCPWEEFKTLVEQIVNERVFKNVTFLGFKDFGFATDSKPFEYPDEWIEWIHGLQKQARANIGVDSIMVSHWKDKLIEAGVSPNQLVGREGSSSCYIDAVTMKVYPSSFAKDHDGVPFTNNEKKFLEVFETL